MSQPFQLTDPNSGKSVALPLISGTQGDPAVDIGKLNKDLGVSPLTLASYRPAQPSRRSLLLMATKVFCSIAVTRLSSWLSIQIFLKSPIY